MEPNLTPPPAPQEPEREPYDLCAELIASRDGGGTGIMLIATPEGGYEFVGLDADDNIITLDPTTVTYGGEFGIRPTEAT